MALHFTSDKELSRVEILRDLTAGRLTVSTASELMGLERRQVLRGTWVTAQVAELPYLHCRDVTFAVLCQGPYEESARYRTFMGWDMPWYSAQGSLDTLLVGRRVGMMHIVCSLRGARGSSRPIGRPGAASRRWTTALDCST